MVGKKQPDEPRKPPGNRPDHHSTAAELESRISIVYGLVLDGCSRREVIRYIAEKTTWDVAPRQVDHYLAAVKAEFVAHADPVREAELGKALNRLDALYRKCMAIQDFKACLAVQKERAELLGLAAPKKLDLNANVKAEVKTGPDFSRLTVGQREQLLALYDLADAGSATDEPGEGQPPPLQ